MSEAKNIYQRILGVMADVAYIQKEDKKVNNQYTFVSHDQVSRVLHPVLVAHGIVVIPTLKAWKQDGNRTEAEVSVRFVNADQPDDCVVVDALGFGIDPQDKGPGKAISYATKYAMLKTFVLETGDDPERDSVNHIGQESQQLAASALNALAAGDWVSISEMDRAGDDAWVGAWKLLGSKDRAAIKKLQTTRDEYRDKLNGMAEADDLSGFAELESELTEREARHLYKLLGDTGQALMSELRKKTA